MVADIFEDTESPPKKFLATSLCTTGTNAPWQVTIVRAQISEVKFRFHKISEVCCRKLIRYSCKAALNFIYFKEKLKPDAENVLPSLFTWVSRGEKKILAYLAI